MRSYEFESGKSLFTGRTVKVIEDKSVNAGTSIVKVNPRDYEKEKKFFDDWLKDDTTTIEIVVDHPSKELHMHVNPSDYNQVIALFENPNI